VSALRNPRGPRSSDFARRCKTWRRNFRAPSPQRRPHAGRQSAIRTYSDGSRLALDRRVRRARSDPFRHNRGRGRPFRPRPVACINRRFARGPRRFAYVCLQCRCSREGAPLPLQPVSSCCFPSLRRRSQTEFASALRRTTPDPGATCGFWETLGENSKCPERL